MEVVEFQGVFVGEPGRDPRTPDKDAELSEMARQMRAAQPWIGAVWKMIGGCVVGVLGGILMDRYLGTTPWGLVGLSVLGICVGFYAFIKTALRLGREAERNKQ